jgi:crotonobetainyl-CoA:carnitine CoA-transferase CaiB-like acyl-CoA transferase
MTAQAPLDGFRVLDFSRVASGPFATMFMADLGAEVVKVERPGVGDETRSLGLMLPGAPAGNTDYYMSMNRRKRSLALDLTSSQGVKIARELASISDIVIENFRPRVADRLGIGFSDLAALRPNLVYTSISGFGPDGPMADRPANDIMMQSLSGLMGATGERGGAPVKVGSSICDLATGLFALSGTLAAVAIRADRPEGQHVQVPMLDASIAMLGNMITSVAAGVRFPRVGRSHPQIVSYASMRCSDDKYVTVGAFSQTFWKRLCMLLGHDEWLDDPRLATNATRLRHRKYLDDEMERIFATKTRPEWVALLEAADIPCAPVLDLDEAIATEQAVHNGIIQRLSKDGVEIGVIRNPIRSEQWTITPPSFPPRLGEDSGSVLRDLLGLDEPEIAELIESGVIAIPD